MTSLQKKAEALEQKIHHLKAQQQQIEHKIVQQLYDVLKSHNGFQIPFPTLLGGIIDVIEQSQTNPQLMEAWNTSGEKFQQRWSKQQSQSKSKFKSKSESKPKPQSKVSAPAPIPSPSTPTPEME